MDKSVPAQSRRDGSDFLPSLTVFLRCIFTNGSISLIVSNKIIRTFLLLLLFAVVFHASGVEMAFCDEAGSSVMGQAHGCVVCQPSQHVFITHQATVYFPNPPVIFCSQSHESPLVVAPVFFFLRPPISL